MAVPRDIPRRSEMKPIDEQITSAISEGFSTIISDFRAQNSEMISALKDISRSTAVSDRINYDRAVAEGRPAPPRRQQVMPVNVSAGGGDMESRLRPPKEYERESLRDTRGTREDIRYRVAKSFTQRADAWTMGALGEDENGNAYSGVSQRVRRGVTVDATGRMIENGNVIDPEDAYETIKYSQNRSMATGVVTGQAEAADDDEIARLLRRSVLASRGSDVVRAWQGGQPIGRALMNSAPKALLRGAGVAAAAVQVADKGWSKVQNEYAENRKYQEYFGGSNMDQFGERFDRWKTGIQGKFSLLGGDAYGQMWDQAMDQGLRGAHRDEYIKYGSRLMGQGVSAGQSGELMKMAMEAGGAETSMRGLVDAIASVNSAAREAGVSAKEAREIFTENYKASTSMMMGDNGLAIQKAQAYTNSQTSMGHAFMNRIDYTGMNTLRSEYLSSAAMGMSPAEYSVMNQTAGPLPGMVAGEDDIRRVLNGLPSKTGETFQQVVERFVKSKEAQGGYSPSHAGELGLELEKAGFEKGLIQEILNSRGIKVDVAAAPGAAGNLFTSNAPSQVFAAEQQGAVEKYSADVSKELEGLGIREGGLIPANYLQVSNTLDVQPSWDQALKNIYTRKGLGQNWSRVPGTVELELLRNIGKYGLDPDTKVKIMAGGKERIVSLEEALRDFSDQITNGSATIVDGDKSGQSIADIMGFSGTSLTQAPAPSATSGDPTVGESVPEFDMSQRANGSQSGEGGALMIDLKPRVAEIFDVFLNGQYYTNGPTG